MGNYLKMSDKGRVLALLELGWSYRRIQRETGVRHETIARYDPRRQAKTANLSTGAEGSADDGESKAANPSAGSHAAHGPPGLAEPYREQIEAGLRQGLTAQRIWQDLCADPAVCYPHSYAWPPASSGTKNRCKDPAGRSGAHLLLRPRRPVTPKRDRNDRTAAALRASWACATARHLSADNSR